MDSNNCGGCNKVCPTGTFCESGTCVCGPLPYMSCSIDGGPPVCTNQFCGMCGVVCDTAHGYVCGSSHSCCQHSLPSCQ
jgi:hypothetical protein